MRRRKWFIPALLLSVLLMGSIVGGLVALADDSSTNLEDQAQTVGRYHVPLDRACAIYEEETGVAIDPEQLIAALGQVRREMQEEALQNRLQNLVDEGHITQEEADRFLEWWQSRPDIKLPLPGLGGHVHRGGMMCDKSLQP